MDFRFPEIKGTARAHAFEMIWSNITDFYKRKTMDKAVF